MPFENGISYYTKAQAIIEFSFPENRCVCQWCPFVRTEDSLKRHKCQLTGEYLVYPFSSVGNQCPVIIDKEDENV